MYCTISLSFFPQYMPDTENLISCLPTVSRVAQSVQCLTTDWTAEVRSPNLYVQTGSGAHPAPYTMGTGGSFPGGKARQRRDADHSLPSSAEVKKD
jgi:hypothetical protein